METFTARPVDPKHSAQPGEATPLSWLGRCADFCTAEGPLTGAEVEVHGPWCRSEPCGREVVTDSDVGVIELSVALARAYLHGTYRLKDYTRVRDTRFVELSLEARHDAARQSPLTLYVTSGAARQLAATLIRAADQADELDRVLADARLTRLSANS